MDVWAQIWPNEHPEGKVHMSAYSVILDRMRELGHKYTIEYIWRMLDRMGISDDVDKLATMRAIRANFR